MVAHPQEERSKPQSCHARHNALPPHPLHVHDMGWEGPPPPGDQYLKETGRISIAFVHTLYFIHNFSTHIHSKGHETEFIPCVPVNLGVLPTPPMSSNLVSGQWWAWLPISSDSAHFMASVNNTGSPLINRDVSPAGQHTSLMTSEHTIIVDLEPSKMDTLRGQ